MEAIFTILAYEGKFFPNNKEEFYKYIEQMSSEEPGGQELLVTMKPLAKVAPKMRMYAYLFGPLMEAAVRGFIHRGYNGIDKVQARYKLQAEFAKRELYNEITKETEITLEDLSGMTKKRLIQFITDCVFYIELELEQTVPDSAEYKAMKGDGFMSMKFKNGER